MTLTLDVSTGVNGSLGMVSGTEVEMKAVLLIVIQ